MAVSYPAARSALYEAGCQENPESCFLKYTHSDSGRYGQIGEETLDAALRLQPDLFLPYVAKQNVYLWIYSQITGSNEGNTLHLSVLEIYRNNK